MKKEKGKNIFISYILHTYEFFYITFHLMNTHFLPSLLLFHKNILFTLKLFFANKNFYFTTR